MFFTGASAKVHTLGSGVAVCLLRVRSGWRTAGRAWFAGDFPTVELMRGFPRFGPSLVANVTAFDPGLQ